MIIELFKYIFSQSSKKARKLGYLHEAIAIESRFNRSSTFWKMHLDNTKKSILSACDQCETKNSILIIGAGSLNDIPIAEISSQFKNVYMLDIVFTRDSRRKMRQFDNIEIIECDISGISDLMKWRNGEPLPKLSIPVLPNITRPNLVVSVNIMSQLPVIPRNHIETAGYADDQSLNKWCSKLLENHITLIRSFDTNTCVITDINHTAVSKNGDELDKFDMLYGLMIGEPQNKWKWNLAPIGEIDPEYSLNATVHCYFNI